MKNLLFFLAALCLSLAASAQTAPNWQLVWSDEFNGPTLDQTKWSYETGTGVNGDFGTGQKDRATDRPENVGIEQGIAGATGGALRITTRKEQYQDRGYTSGRINTKDKANWGPNHRIVARVWPKGVKTMGQGFAFWMLGNEAPVGVQELTWPQVGEIDIMEYVGSIPDHNLGTVHYAWQYNNNQYADWNRGQKGAYYNFAQQQTPDSPEWIRVDLGAVYSVGRVNLTWENNGKTYNIETSTNGTTWNPAYSTTTGDGGVDDVAFAARDARFVRVNGTARANNYGYSLFELQVFAANGTTNLALGRQATSSSDQAADLAPGLAVDGNVATRWSSGVRNPQYQCCTPANNTDPNIGSNGWHEYGIDWFADRMEFFVDGNVYHIHYFNDGAAFGTTDGENEEGVVVINGKKVVKSEYSNLYSEWHPFEHKMYAILSSGVGGGYTYGGPIVDQAVFPVDVYVDWMRVYSNGLTFNPPPTVALTAPTGLETYPAPGTITLTATATDREGGTISKVEFFNGTTLLGSDNTAPYTFNWTNVPAGNYSVTAKATDNGGVTGTSSTVKVAVNGPASNLALNRPGTASSTTGNFGANNAFDANPATKWESLYVNSGESIYVDLGNTYAINRVKILWETAMAEDYEIKLSPDKLSWTTARSVTGNTVTVNDLTGLSGSARYVGIFGTKKRTQYGYSIFNVEVYGPGGSTPGNTAPAVSLTAPAANAAFTAPATINLTATATDADGSISQVAFYNGSTPLGTDNAAPYSFSWTNVAAGSYSVTARATDNAGATTTSAAVAVTVGGPPSSTGDLARGKAATASSVRDGNLATYAVDGQAGTRWESALTDDQWIYVDLGAVYNVNRVKIEWEGAYGADYNVQVGSPTTSWTTIKPVTGNTALTNDWTGLSGSGQYVRIQGLRRGTGWGYSIFQLEVYGTLGTAPSTGTTVPGRIEAESFSAQSGIQTEPTADTGGGLNVGYIDAGDFLDYAVSVQTAGTYTIGFRVASWQAGAQLQLKSGATVLATVPVPATGGGQTYATVAATVPLAAGSQTLRVAITGGGFNFNWLNFSLSGARTALATKAGAADAVRGYPNPTEHTFYLPGFRDGAAVAISSATGNTVRATALRNGAVDVRQLPAGLYILTVTDGPRVARVKMLKK